MTEATAKVARDYIAREDNELTIVQGDVIKVKDMKTKINRDSGEWMHGILDDGSEGIFPVANVVFDVDLEESSSSTKMDSSASVDDEMARVEKALKQAQLEKEMAEKTTMDLKASLKSVDEDAPLAPTPRKTADDDINDFSMPTPETNDLEDGNVAVATPNSAAGSPSNAVRTLRKKSKGGLPPTPKSPTMVQVTTGKAPQIIVRIVTGHIPVKWDWTDPEKPVVKQYGCYPRHCFVHLRDDDDTDDDSGDSDNEQAENEKKRKMAEEREKLGTGKPPPVDHNDLSAGTVNVARSTKVGEIEKLIRRKQGKLAVIDEKGRQLRLDEPFEFFSSAHDGAQLLFNQNLEAQGILEPLKIRMDADALKEEQKRLEKRQAQPFAQPAGKHADDSREEEEKPAGLRILHHCSVYQEIEDGSAYGRQGHIDLSYRELEDVPQLLFQEDRCQGVSCLMLNENNFTYVPKDIGKLRNLRTLMLGGNNLSRVPDGIEELVLLQNLQLSNNVITDVNWQLARLANLRNLYLDGNKLRSLPYELRVLTKLEELQIGDNKFTEIPSQCFGMTSLTDLWLQGNKIRIIPNTIKKLQRLKRLELSGNQIFTIPREIGHLVKLESLFLSANKLTDAGVPNEMIYMTSLKTLYLQGNLILRRPGVLKEMQLNGNLEVCQIGVGAVVKGTLLRVFTEAAKGADADIDTIAIRAFSKYDEDGGGSIDAEEFALLVKDMGVHLTDEEFAGAMDYIDEDDSGEIDTDEFLSWLKED